MYRTPALVFPALTECFAVPLEPRRAGLAPDWSAPDAGLDLTPPPELAGMGVDTRGGRKARTEKEFNEYTGLASRLGEIIQHYKGQLATYVSAYRFRDPQNQLGNGAGGVFVGSPDLTAALLAAGAEIARVKLPGETNVMYTPKIENEIRQLMLDEIILSFPAVEDADYQLMVELAHHAGVVAMCTLVRNRIHRKIATRWNIVAEDMEE